MHLSFFVKKYLRIPLRNLCVLERDKFVKHKCKNRQKQDLFIQCMEFLLWDVVIEIREKSFEMEFYKYVFPNKYLYITRTTGILHYYKLNGHCSKVFGFNLRKGDQYLFQFIFLL